MSDITLTAGIRQNLLSLQQTSAELTSTQEALATGKAVNSAADNPSAYFTAQNLTNDANSLSSLLDQIGQALQTIDAANNGLTGITSLLQQALSTVQQAQSDSWTIAAAATGTQGLASSATTGATDLTSTTATTSGSLNLNALTAGTITGTAVTATVAAGTFTIDVGPSTTYSVSIAASDTATQVASAIQAQTSGAVTASASGNDLVLSSSSSVVIDDSATAQEIGLGNATISPTFTNPTSGGTLTIVQGASSYSVAITANEGASAVESAINGVTGSALSATVNGSGDLVLSSTTGGFTVGGSAATALGLTAGSVTAALDNPATAGTLTIVAGASTYGVSVTAGEAASSIAAAIGTATGNVVTAAVNGGGDLVLSSNAASGFTVENSTTANSLGVTSGSANTTVTPATNASVPAGNLLIAVGSTTYSVSVAASASLAQIESDINNTTGLGSNGAVTASDDGDGHLVITSNSAPSGFTIVGNAVSAALGLTSSSTTDNTPLGSSTTRGTLQTNYDTLLQQINQMASDSGYNGVNLLGGDNLVIDFNQSGTSLLTIDGVNYNAQGLNLSTIDGTGTGSFNDNGALGDLVTALNTAISNVQSQTETFGTNSSTISTRQTFTTAMINTLQTGSSNLTAADQNEESADLLTEQTQQQLEISALSIANQANQSVLKLFS